MNRRVKDRICWGIIAGCGVILCANWMLASGAKPDDKTPRAADAAQASAASPIASEVTAVDDDRSTHSATSGAPAQNPQLAGSESLRQSTAEPRNESAPDHAPDSVEAELARLERRNGGAGRRLDVSANAWAAHNSKDDGDGGGAFLDANDASLKAFLEKNPLEGLIVAGERSTALCGGYVLRVGDTLPGTRAKIASIGARAIVLERGSARLEIALPPFVPRPSEESDKAAPNAQPGGDPKSASAVIKPLASSGGGGPIATPKTAAASGAASDSSPNNSVKNDAKHPD